VLSCNVTLVVGGSQEDSMRTQIVMDHTGDTRHHFDANDRAEIAKAEKRFMELTVLSESWLELKVA
jgi:hypothetical protein